MRWWLVTGDFPPGYTGGIASFTEDLAQALLPDDLTVLARASGDTRAEDAARPYPVIRVHGRSWADWQGVWTLAAGAARIGAGDRVIFTTWPLAGWLGPLARARGARVGVTFHGSDLTRLARAPAAMRRALASAHALLPVSDFLGAELRRLGFAATATLPMPLPLDLPPAPPGPALRCVARLTPLKGVDRAITLARALGRPLQVVGDGPEEGRLRALAAGADVTFYGRRARVEIGAMPGAAALLLSRPDVDGSGAEGLGLTLLEAAAQGLPCVGTATGGVPEAVGPGVVLPDADGWAASDLARVAALLADPGAGGRARDWVRARHGAAAAATVVGQALRESQMASGGI